MKKKNNIFEDLKKRLDNCTFNDDEETNSVIKNNFKSLVERAEYEIKIRQEFSYVMATIVGCIALYGKEGIFWASQSDKTENEYFKDFLEEILKMDKIEISLKNGTIEFRKEDE